MGLSDEQRVDIIEIGAVERQMELEAMGDYIAHSISKTLGRMFRKMFKRR